MAQLSPLVTILMPAYNCEKFIDQSIIAILNQTFKDFEFIIINDGSSDSTNEIIKKYDDKRIRFYENKVNSGIVKTLNWGLELSKGKYIVRTDADDIARTDLVSSLLEFMETHQDYIVCGGYMKLINSEKIFSYPNDNDFLRVHTLTFCPFSHSTVILKKSILAEKNIKYEETFKDGEDHALWAALLPFGKFYNLNKITLDYRESSTQVTATNVYSKNRIETREKIFSFQAKEYFELNNDQAYLYVKLIDQRKVISLEELNKVGQLIITILNYNKKKKLFKHAILKKLFFIKWHWLCFHSYHLGKNVGKIYLKYILLSKNLTRIKSLATHFLIVVRPNRA